MYDCTGWIVQSTAGHDKGIYFCVVGRDEDGRLLLANGKQRKLSAPKRKKPGHVQQASEGVYDNPTIAKLQTNQPVSDRELRRTLAAFKGRYLAWQRTI